MAPLQGDAIGEPDEREPNEFVALLCCRGRGLRPCCICFRPSTSQGRVPTGHECHELWIYT